MENQIDENIKNIRSQELIRLNEENQTAYEERFLGRKTEILFEEKISVEEKEYYIGHTREYIKAACLADADYSNCLMEKTLRGRLKNHLLLCEN